MAATNYYNVPELATVYGRTHTRCVIKQTWFIAGSCEVTFFSENIPWSHSLFLTVSPRVHAVYTRTTYYYSPAARDTCAVCVRKATAAVVYLLRARAHHVNLVYIPCACYPGPTRLGDDVHDVYNNIRFKYIFRRFINSHIYGVFEEKSFTKRTREHYINISPIFHTYYLPTVHYPIIPHDGYLNDRINFFDHQIMLPPR